MDLFFCHLATFFINLGKNWLILKPCLTAALEVNLNADFDNRTLQSLSILATTSQSYFLEHKVISKVEWINKKKSADFRFHGSKSGLVYMLKVVHSLAFDTMLFHKSSFIFPMEQLSLCKIETLVKQKIFRTH